MKHIFCTSFALLLLSSYLYPARERTSYTKGESAVNSHRERGTAQLPAWIGSIMFHSIVFLLVLLWFSFSSDSDRTAPGDRIAAGSILLQPSGGDRQHAEVQNNLQHADSEVAMFGREPLSRIDLRVLPLVHVLAQGQNQSVSGGAGSATDLTETIRQGVPGGSGIGNQAGETTVQIFGTNGKGTRFMYVFDRSTSMEGAPIRAAKAELIRSLDALDEHHQFNIIFYSASRTQRRSDGWLLWQQGRKLIFASESNKQNATRFISAITPDGGTWHYDPLLEAIAHRPDVIFFLTDGESHDDLTTVQLREIEQRNSQFGRQVVQINVIQFGSGGLTDRQSPSLQQLAHNNLGQYKYVNVQELR